MGFTLEKTNYHPMHWYRRLIQVKASKSVHKSVKYAADLGWLEGREHLHGATCLTHFSKITQSCSFARAVFSYQFKRLTHQLAWLWDSWGREKKIECEGLASVKGWRAVEGLSRLDKAPRISIRVVPLHFSPLSITFSKIESQQCCPIKISASLTSSQAIWSKA